MTKIFLLVLMVVLDALRSSGQEESTQVIYTSDHGDMIGNHGIWCKSYMYEDSVGIPMTLTGPGIEPGVNPTPVSLTDLASTIALGVGSATRVASKKWQGTPLQLIAEAVDEERPVISEYHDGGSPCGFYMLRRGRWKLVYYSEGNPPLLFDMENDSRELNNLADDPGHSGVLQTMFAQLQEILDPEEINRQAFSDQAKMVEKLGGMDNILAMPSFNHTPLD